MVKFISGLISEQERGGGLPTPDGLPESSLPTGPTPLGKQPVVPIFFLRNRILIAAPGDGKPVKSYQDWVPGGGFSPAPMPVRPELPTSTPTPTPTSTPTPPIPDAGGPPATYPPLYRLNPLIVNWDGASQAEDRAVRLLLRPTIPGNETTDAIRNLLLEVQTNGGDVGRVVDRVIRFKLGAGRPTAGDIKQLVMQYGEHIPPRTLYDAVSSLDEVNKIQFTKWYNTQGRQEFLRGIKGLLPIAIFVGGIRAGVTFIYGSNAREALGQFMSGVGATYATYGLANVLRKRGLPCAAGPIAGGIVGGAYQLYEEVRPEGYLATGRHTEGQAIATIAATIVAGAIGIRVGVQAFSTVGVTAGSAVAPYCSPGGIWGILICYWGTAAVVGLTAGLGTQIVLDVSASAAIENGDNSLPPGVKIIEPNNSN